MKRKSVTTRGGCWAALLVFNTAPYRNKDVSTLDHRTSGFRLVRKPLVTFYEKTIYY